MSNATPQKWLIHELSKSTVTRILPELAIEIGLNESIVLMQISFWLSTCNNLQDGKYWTYQTLREMKEKAFPYWSIETIRRTLQSLESQGYIHIANYNQRKGDRTQWFALDPERLSTLKSIVVLPVDTITLVSKRDKLSQNETPTQQNVTTLPETTTDKESFPAKAENVSQTKSVKSKRPPDPLYDAIAKVWGINAGGWVGNLKSMMLGVAKRGEWHRCNFNPPVSSADEILGFEPYMLKRMAEKKITDKPTACVTIQRWFYDYRLEKSKPAPSVLDGLRLVS